MASETEVRDPLDGLRSRLAADGAALDRELAEIDLLVSQARTEAGRHEARRAQLAEKGGEPEQLLTLTRRAAVMEAQVDVLEGKRKSLGRYREALRDYESALAGVESASAGAADGSGGAPGAGVELPPETSRVILTAQEDLRREIARAMHDGPAQSLTNIVLQAQIVERLMARDAAAAEREVRQLVGMVQQTLEATKAFIFDVRPMVLDDLGLVPTLRRGARDRGRRANVPVEFETVGADRRLDIEVESTVFRMLDEALAAFLAQAPRQVSLRLDWADKLTAVASAAREVQLPPPDEFATREPGPSKKGKDAKPAELPPALAEMVETRRAAHEAAVQAARDAAVVHLPADVRRELAARAATIDAALTIDQRTGELRLVVPLAERAADEPSP